MMMRQAAQTDHYVGDAETPGLNGGTRRLLSFEESRLGEEWRVAFNWADVLTELGLLASELHDVKEDIIASFLEPLEQAWG